MSQTFNPEILTIMFKFHYLLIISLLQVVYFSKKQFHWSFFSQAEEHPCNLSSTFHVAVTSFQYKSYQISTTTKIYRNDNHRKQTTNHIHQTQRRCRYRTFSHAKQDQKNQSSNEEYAPRLLLIKFQIVIVKKIWNQ